MSPPNECYFVWELHPWEMQSVPLKVTACPLWVQITVRIKRTVSYTGFLLQAVDVGSFLPNYQAHVVGSQTDEVTNECFWKETDYGYQTLFVTLTVIMINQVPTHAWTHGMVKLTRDEKNNYDKNCTEHSKSSLFVCFSYSLHGSHCSSLRSRRLRRR